MGIYKPRKGTWNRSSLTVLKGNHPYKHLDLRLLAYRTMRNKLLFFKPSSLWYFLTAVLATNTKAVLLEKLSHYRQGGKGTFIASFFALGAINQNVVFQAFPVECWGRVPGYGNTILGPSSIIPLETCSWHPKLENGLPFSSNAMRSPITSTRVVFSSFPCNQSFVNLWGYSDTLDTLHNV